MSEPDDVARAASDAIDAYCAANPAPAWPTLPDGVRPWDFAEVWSGTLEHDSVSGETTARFGTRTEPVVVTYTTVRDQARAMIDASPELQQSIAELVQAGATDDEARAVIEAMAVVRLREGATNA
jgi:hypothetical protein